MHSVENSEQSMAEYIRRRVFSRGVLFKIVEEIAKNREFFEGDERKNRVIKK